jgi:hypothetical protein
VYIVTGDREMWKNPETGGKMSFKILEHRNGLVAPNS